MKYVAAMLSACVLAISGCAVTVSTPESSAPNYPDSQNSEEFDASTERVFRKREKIERLLKKIRGDGS